MDKKELKTFIVQHNQIHHFCLEILNTLENDYPDVLGGEDNIMGHYSFFFDDLVIYYQNNKKADSISISPEDLLSFDVEGACEHIARLKRELDQMIDEKLGADEESDPNAN